MLDFEINLEYRAENLTTARQKMEDVLNALKRLGREPDSTCLVFSDPTVQEVYEKILSKEVI